MNLGRNKKPAKRRAARRNRRQHLLEVTATAETERRRRKQKILLYAGEAVVLVGLLVLAWLAVRTLVDYLILDNEKYEVRVVEVNTDGVMTREEVLALTGLREGLNIFSLNLEAAQQALASIPEVSKVRVERQIPDTVTVEIEARRPVAWVAPKDIGADPSSMESACLVDANGVIMKPRGFEASRTRLPVIYGVPTEQWRPGERVDIPALHAALELFLRADEMSDAGIDLRAADIARGWCITAWGDPQSRFTFGLENIPSQIDRLQLILAHTSQTPSRKIATVNLIPERNTPVTFQGEAPPAEESAKRQTAP